MVTDNYKVEVYISSQWIENEIDIRSLSINEVLYKKLKPADSSASFSFVPNQTLYNQLKTTNGDIPVRIKKNNVVIFTGYVRRNFDINKTQKLEPLKIEVVSPSFLLKRKIGFDIEYKSKSVTFILNDLLTKAGLSLFTLPTISAVIPGLYIEVGKETYHSIIEKMLWEYGFTFGFNKEGILVVYKLKPDSLATSKIFDGSNCLNRINQKAEEEEIKHVVVDWVATKTLTNPIVFSDTTNAQNGYKCYIELPPNSYLNGEQYWKADLSMADGEVLVAEGLAIDIIKDADIQVLTFEPVGNRVRLSIKNNNPSVSKFIKKLDIKATSAIVKLEGTNKSIVIKEPGTEKIEEVQTKYIYEKQYGDALANLLGWYYNYSDYKYKISSKTNYDLNDIVTIIDSHIGTNKARIVEKKTNHFTDVIEYSLEAIDEYVPSPVSNELTYSPPVASGVIDSIQTVVEAGLSSNGSVIKPIDSNTMITDITPTGDGLYLTKTYIGLRKNNDWASFIKNDGTFSFKGDNSNYVTWDNSKVQIKGDLHLSGNSTVSGKITTGSIQSTSYTSGTSGFSLNSNGSAEFNNVTVRGAVYASSGTFGGIQITGSRIRSSNYVAGVSGFYIDNVGQAEFNNINVRGTINSTSGAIGGWNITSDKLISSLSGSRIELNKGLNRVSIFDSSNIEKIVVGYLNGCAKNSGVGTYTSADYGIWVKPGNTAIVDGSLKLLNGDMTATDSSFKVFSGTTEVIRCGTDTGVNGLHFYNTNGKVSLSNSSTDSLNIKSDSGYIKVGCENTSHAHLQTDRGSFYMNKQLQVAGMINVYGTTYGIDSTGKGKFLSGTGSDSNTVYIKDSNNQLKERAIQSGVWSYNYNQNLLNTSDVQFAKVKITSGTGTNSNTVYTKDSNNQLKERTIQTGVWDYNYNQNLTTTSNVTFKEVDSVYQYTDKMYTKVTKEGNWGFVGTSWTNNGVKFSGENILLGLTQLSDNSFLFIDSNSTNYIERVRESDGTWHEPVILPIAAPYTKTIKMRELPDRSVVLIEWTNYTLYEWIRDKYGTWTKNTTPIELHNYDTRLRSLEKLDDNGRLILFYQSTGATFYKIRSENGTWESGVSLGLTIDSATRLTDGRFYLQSTSSTITYYFMNSTTYAITGPYTKSVPNYNSGLCVRGLPNGRILFFYAWSGTIWSMYYLNDSSGWTSGVNTGMPTLGFRDIVFNSNGQIVVYASSTTSAPYNTTEYVDNSSGTIAGTYYEKVGSGIVSSNTNEEHTFGNGLLMHWSNNEKYSFRNFYRHFGSYEGLSNQYVHMKTSTLAPLNSIIPMWRLHAHGYVYGSGQNINAFNVGYWYGPNFAANVTSGSHTIIAYRSSDGYLVFSLYIPGSMYYTGFLLDVEGSQQGVGITIITNVKNTSSQTGAF